MGQGRAWVPGLLGRSPAAQQDPNTQGKKWGQASMDRSPGTEEDPETDWVPEGLSLPTRPQGEANTNLLEEEEAAGTHLLSPDTQDLCRTGPSTLDPTPQCRSLRVPRAPTGPRPRP